MNLGLVFHNHQPVNNDDKAIEFVYRRSYLPFLETLSAYPELKGNLHYSGYLLEWLDKNHPKFISLLRKMVDRGQVEILGGGYYEPILSVIPENDAEGQVNLLRKNIESIFSVQSEGVWTAERAWEPQEPEVLARCGVLYTLLDDTIFRLTGLHEYDCFHPYLVESRGSAVTIFPLLRTLRHFIPFEKVSQTISYLKEHNDRSEAQIAIFADDGEKFGAWPTTYEQVYERGWLNSFFRSLLSNKSWINTVTLSEYLSRYPANEKIVLPSASYEELMEWSILQKKTVPSDAKERHFGFWRLFLSKYPESDRLYSKMLHISKIANQISPSKLKKTALMEIWKAQYNDVYWHGVFGGLYFPKFRRNAYHYLINAEKMLDSLLHRGQTSWNSAATYGSDYLSLATKSLQIVASPSSSGSIIELDFKPMGVNLFDTLTRRYEKYHDNIRKKSAIPRRGSRKAMSIHGPVYSKEKGLYDLLVYDRYLKTSFIDYFVDGDCTIDNFSTQNFNEFAHFAGRPYRARFAGGDKKSILLRHTSATNEEKSQVGLRKILALDEENSEVTVDYDIKMKGRFPRRRNRRSWFAVEINLASLADPAFERVFSKPLAFPKTEKLNFDYGDIGMRVTLHAKIATTAWVLPLKTVSQSESGVESNFQGISIILPQPIDIDEDRRERKFKFGFELEIERK
jgi:4-alpha-glucanotransferase